MPENTPGSRDANLNSTTEQVPHSGVHGYEQPVFHFDGQSLQEALDRGDLHIEYDETGKPKVIVPDTLGDHVDPTQSTKTEVHAPLVAAEKASKSRRLKTVVASIVGAALLGGGYAGYSALNNDRPEHATTSVSPENNAPSIDVETMTPEQLVGTPVDNNLEKLNTRPNQDVLDSVADPILVENVTLDDAVMQLGDKLNAFYLSADTDIDMSTDAKMVIQTPESIEKGNILLGEIFSSTVDVESPSLDWLRGVRANTSHRLNYYGTDKQYSKVTGDAQYATSDTYWTVDTIESQTTDTANIIVDATLLTNFEELDRDDVFDHPEIDTNQTFQLNISMVDENGEWRLQSITPANS